MSLRLATLTGAGLYGAAGPLLIVAAWMALGAVGAVGVALAWAGVGVLLGVLLVAARTQRDMARRIAALRKTLAAAQAVSPPDLEAALRALEERQAAAAEQRDGDLQAVVDARIVGLHAMVEDLAARAGRPGDRAPGEGAPGDRAPREAAPGEAAPGDGSPDERAPGEWA